MSSYIQVFKLVVKKIQSAQTSSGLKTKRLIHKTVSMKLPIKFEMCNFSLNLHKYTEFLLLLRILRTLLLYVSVFDTHIIDLKS